MYLFKQFFKPSWIRLILPIIVLTSITACGSDSDKVVDGLNKDKQATIGLVNAANERATFYAKARVLNRGTFDSENRVTDILQDNSADYIYKFNKTTEETRFGVRDAATQTKSATFDIDIDDQASYWLIAWLDGNAYRLTGFKKSAANQVGVFRVRVFANSALSIRLNGSNTVVATTEKGRVTTYFSVDNCATGLRLGNNFINICNDVVFGKSYLAVIDDGVKAVVAEG